MILSITLLFPELSIRSCPVRATPSVAANCRSACGGAPCTSECGTLAVSSLLPNACEGDACRQTPPRQSSLTLRHGGMGTNSNILHVASGGIHPDPSTDDSCGRTVWDPDRAGDACRLTPHGQPCSTLRLVCTCANGSILHVVSGGSSLPPFHEFDGSLQTLPQPLSPPMPSTAAIHDHGHVSALLRVSVSRVNSTPHLLYRRLGSSPGYGQVVHTLL